MLKSVLLFVSLGFILPLSQSKSQSLQIDERFGMQVNFPEGWSLLSEDLYSSLLQRQLFASSNEEIMVYVELVFMMPELDKWEWASGANQQPLSTSEIVIPVERKDWKFKPPEFRTSNFSKYPNGMSVFIIGGPNWKGYTIFVSRSDAFTRINFVTSKEGIEPELEDIEEILSTLTFSSEPPVMHEDPYTIADRVMMFERDYEQAIFHYKQVPKSHPKYVDAQRAIGYRILGKQFDDWESAVPYVEEAYNVSPDDPKVLEDIGRVYLRTGRQEQGIGYLKKAGTRVARKALQEQGIN